MLEKVNLGYSTKNIPLADKKNYKVELVRKTEALIKRMRWKAIFFLARDKNEVEEDADRPETFGLPSKKCPSQVKELIQFENDLLKLVKDIEFREFQETGNEFQARMRRDIKNMRNSGKTLTPADKTSNMYRLSKDEYTQLKKNAVTAKYKKASKNIKEKIDKGSVKIAKKAGILGRMDQNCTNNCFITLKDHKENFQNNPSTRLINPAKNEVGRISKVILDNINKKLQERLGVNQWKSTQDVIKWFSSIQNKDRYTFTVFDIKDFYPSIKESLLKEALQFAAQRVDIPSKDMEAVRYARKSLLFDDSHTWIKRDGGLFDVTMGAFDGAEICELVGTYLLSLIAQKYEKKDIGLYRDDGLAAFKDKSGPQNERIKKDFTRIFKEKGLDLVISCNMKIVDYLELTLSLLDGSYRPFRKPDDETNYVHTDSDHPPSILKQIPLSIEKRLSTISSSEAIFNESKDYYQEALKRSGHTHVLKYNPPRQARRQRKKNVIYYNPPFSKIVKTNIGMKFLRLIDVHFPENSKFRKIFNRNTVKVSYGCMPNVAAIINGHNRSILEDNKPDEGGGCNCRTPANCPLQGECLKKGVMYEATVTSDLANYGEQPYIGISGPIWKSRFQNHVKSFNHERYRNETELSKEIWRIKEKNGNYHVSWRILKQYPTYNPASKKCMLCANEKVAILYYSGANLLNKRSEIISTCRHRKKYELGEFDVS